MTMGMWNDENGEKCLTKNTWKSAGLPIGNGCAAPGAGEGSDALQSIPAEGFSL